MQVTSKRVRVNKKVAERVKTADGDAEPVGEGERAGEGERVCTAGCANTLAEEAKVAAVTGGRLHILVAEEARAACGSNWARGAVMTAGNDERAVSGFTNSMADARSARS